MHTWIRQSLINGKSPGRKDMMQDGMTIEITKKKPSMFYNLKNCAFHIAPVDHSLAILTEIMRCIQMEWWYLPSENICVRYHFCWHTLGSLCCMFVASTKMVWRLGVKSSLQVGCDGCTCGIEASVPSGCNVEITYLCEYCTKLSQQHKSCNIVLASCKFCTDILKILWCCMTVPRALTMLYKACMIVTWHRVRPLQMEPH